MNSKIGSRSRSPQSDSVDDDVDHPNRKPRSRAQRLNKSVTDLSAAQRARKRALDREAQRNIRKRRKEQLDSLEVALVEKTEQAKQLQDRNEALEETVATLKAELSTDKPRSRSPKRESRERNYDVFDRNRLGHQDIKPSMLDHVDSYRPPRTWTPPSTAHEGHIFNDTSAPYPPPPEGSSFGAASISNPKSYTTDSEASSMLYTTAIIPEWSSMSSYSGRNGTHTSPSSSPSPRISSMTPPRFHHPTHPSPPQYQGFQPSWDSTYNISCWQNQPSIYAWQISTKLSGPSTPTDVLILSAIHVQRHLACTSNPSLEALIGPLNPRLDSLFPRKSSRPFPDTPAHPLAVAISTGTSALAALIPTIPKQVATFLCTYRLCQFQISPSLMTYRNLFPWQEPRPSQIVTPHPAWMDFPPWGKFRDRLIENQQLYANVDFMLAYTLGLDFHWPYDPLEAVEIRDGNLVPSRLLVSVISDLGTFRMTRTFMEQYPEFKGLCPFIEE